jgi:alpha-tubulin suppressor-like RCC1 family protein
LKKREKKVSCGHLLTSSLVLPDYGQRMAVYVQLGLDHSNSVCFFLAVCLLILTTAGKTRVFNPPPAIERKQKLAGQTVSAWGNAKWDGKNAYETPRGFVAVSCGAYHTCALDNTDRARCWGLNDDGQLDVPPGMSFQQIVAGSWHTCGIDAYGRAHCWGWNSYNQLSPPPGIRFRSLSGGAFNTCGLTSEGVAHCWGDNRFNHSSPPSKTSSGEDIVFMSVSAGTWHSCGVDLYGTGYCWGQPDDGRTTVPPGITFDYISSGGAHSCGTDVEGKVHCWGLDAEKQVSSVPSGLTFKTPEGIDAGLSYTCGIDMTHYPSRPTRLVCWGANKDKQLDVPRGLKAQSVSSGESHACIVDVSGVLHCWGRDIAGQASPPLVTDPEPTEEQRRVLKEQTNARIQAQIDERGPRSLRQLRANAQLGMAMTPWWFGNKDMYYWPEVEIEERGEEREYLRKLKEGHSARSTTDGEDGGDDLPTTVESILGLAPWGEWASSAQDSERDDYTINMRWYQSIKSDFTVQGQAGTDHS